MATPKSRLRTKAITACKSSRFFPVTRIWRSWSWLCTFEVLALDGVNDFLRLVAFEPLLDFQFLPGVAERRDRGLDLLDIAQIDAALAQFPDHDLAQTAQADASSAVSVILSFSATISATLPLKSKRVASSLRA